MKRGDVPAGITLVAGACVFLVLQDELVASWLELYPRGALPDLLTAAEVGLVDAWSGDAPGPLRKSQLVIFGMAFALGAVRLGSNVSETLTYWFGFMLPMVCVLAVGRIMADFVVPNAGALAEWGRISAETIRQLGRARLSTEAFLFETARIGVLTAAGTTAAYLSQVIVRNLRALAPRVRRRVEGLLES